MTYICYMSRFFLCWFLLASAFLPISIMAQEGVVTGAMQLERYLPKLKGKRVALLVNQTSMIGATHLVDTLLSRHVNIVTIFAPEHGFRGGADAGEHIASGTDAQTGLKVTSMYGDRKKPSEESMKGIDLVLFDIQDVGARFYTYISSLQYMMEACAEHGIPLMVLDRPNPNGFYVDGPVLEAGYRSFVGMQPVPIVHGMTVGEYASMLNGEHWLQQEKPCRLDVIPCLGYDHRTRYAPPVPPSPNLRTLQAINLYPSLCLFEGTIVSVGRGTETPFEIFGFPTYRRKDFSFTPRSMPGAKSPPYNNQRCYGENLHVPATERTSQIPARLQPGFLLQAYQQAEDTSGFFTPFFEKLAGTASLRKQVMNGESEEAIRQSWQPGLDRFKAIRKKYLLYRDFE